MPKKTDPTDSPSSASEATSATDAPPTDAAATTTPAPDAPPAAPPTSAAEQPAAAATLPDEIPAPEGPTIEEHAKACDTHPAIFAAMKAYFMFGEGRRMTREHYELAIDKVANLQFQ